MNRILVRAGAALLLLILLSACSWLPLSYTLDLRRKLGSSASGTVQQPIRAGNSGDIAFRHPDDDGECIGFSNNDNPVAAESARMHYNASVDYFGSRVSGRVAAQLYLSHEQSDL